MLNLVLFVFQRNMTKKILRQIFFVKFYCYFFFFANKIFFSANYKAEKPILEMIGSKQDALVLTQDNVNIVPDFMQHQGNEPLFRSRFVSIQVEFYFCRCFTHHSLLHSINYKLHYRQYYISYL
jgi:hypothetical protein